MKKLLIILFLAIGLSGMAQKPLKAFLRPVPDSLFKIARTIDRDITVDQKSYKLLLRPVIGMTGVQWNWNKIEKEFNKSAFDWVGAGVGIQHFIEVNGLPFNDYGANALLLLGDDISAAVTFSGFGILNLGVVYNFTINQPGVKQLGLLTAIQIKF